MKITKPRVRVSIPCKSLIFCFSLRSHKKSPLRFFIASTSDFMWTDINTLANTGKPLQRGTPSREVTIFDLLNLLDQYPETAAEIARMISALHTRYPTLPPPKVNYPDGPWPREKPYWVHHSHLTNDRQMAINNLGLAGRILDETEDKYLDYLLQHPTGWSATSCNHHNDSCFKYIQHQFHPQGELFPILDDMTWPEEAASFASRICPGEPIMFLLSDSTWYFVYLFETDELLKAGKTLQDVYHGFREGQHSQMSKNRWETMSDTGVEYDHWDYFSDWRWLHGPHGEARWEAVRPALEIFVPKILDESDGDEDEDYVEEM